MNRAFVQFKYLKLERFLCCTKNRQIANFLVSIIVYAFDNPTYQQDFPKICGLLNQMAKDKERMMLYT